MPQIRRITDFRDENELSELCHASREPVFLTEDGHDVLVVMSIETYEAKLGKLSAEDRARLGCFEQDK